MKTSLRSRLGVALLAAALSLGLLSSCAFVESAAQLLVGSPQVPRVTLDIAWPSVESLSGLSQQEMASIQGFPTTFKWGTLAHLQGALTMSGECSMVKDGETPPNQTKLSKLSVRATNCVGDPRCAGRCKAFEGVEVEIRFDVELLNEANAKKVREELSDTSSDAIVQIRLRFFTLDVYQAIDAIKENTNARYAALEMSLSGADGQEAIFMRDRDFDLVKPGKPQRFDVDSTSPVTHALKASVVAGKVTSATVVVRARVAQPDLYELMMTGGGLVLDAQPEIVINVLEVAKSKL